MGLDIIAAAKNILIKQQKVNMGEDHEDMKLQYKALQTQVRSLEQKIDILLKKLPWVSQSMQCMQCKKLYF